VTVDILPDDVLVEIFNFYIDIGGRLWYPLENTWHALVHVCRRWRYLVLTSPRRLNLQLKYGGHRPLSKVLGVWPVLPVILVSSDFYHPESDHRWDNRVAALESKHYNRICEIHITDMTNPRWRRFAAAMQKPFPELTCLEVTARGDVEPVLPDSFLGGSAPHLRTLFLRRIPFPSMPKLLLSGLVSLFLWDIPDSGYISPDAMATALTVMTRLETLNLWFGSPRSRPGPASRPLPPPTRFVLPALTKLSFQGVYGYLEDLLARTDAPLLYHLHIAFFMDWDFYVPQLHRFIDQAEEFKTFAHAEMLISDFSIWLDLYSKTGLGDYGKLRLEIRESDWQLSSFARVCRSSFPLISALEELRISISRHDDLESSHWQDNMEWLGFLDPFTAVTNLYLTRGIASCICGALQELSRERAFEVLPALRNLYIDGLRPLEHIEEAIRPFTNARQLSGYPVAIDHW
jgi:F-box-like